MSSQRSPIGLIFLTVFISMVGFGIVIPVLPVYANSEPFLMKPSELGFLVGVFLPRAVGGSAVVWTFVGSDWA